VNINYLEPYTEIEVDSRISPLICACYLGRMEIVKMLLMNESIDVDLATEDSGQTPLTISAITGNYEIMKLLVDAGGEVNKPNAFNQTPIICCFARLEEVPD
jgi:ankyrin repeat protein